jgi:hypothetical protein
LLFRTVSEKVVCMPADPKKSGSNSPFWKMARDLLAEIPFCKPVLNLFKARGGLVKKIWPFVLLVIAVLIYWHYQAPPAVYSTANRSKTTGLTNSVAAQVSQSSNVTVKSASDNISQTIGSGNTGILVQAINSPGVTINAGTKRRELIPEAIERISSKVKLAPPFLIHISCTLDNEESCSLGKQIETAIAGGGSKTSGVSQASFLDPFRGLRLFAHSAPDQKIQGALKQIFVELGMPPRMGIDNKLPADWIEIEIGTN